MKKELAVKENWIGYCEFCGFKPIVKAADEKEAIGLLEQSHRKKRGNCNGGPMILVAFRLNEINK